MRDKNTVSSDIQAFYDASDSYTIILGGYRGSIAHNMYIPNTDPNSIDDIDLLGFVVGELGCYFGLQSVGSRGTIEQKAGKYDIVYYELRKAVTLLLQGNPNILGMLWLRPEHYLVKEYGGATLLTNRDLFVGKHVYNAFAGYAHAQLEKMESRDPAELREYIAVTWEAKYRGIHPNHKGAYFLDNEPITGELKNVKNWSNEKLLAKIAYYCKKGENIGYMGDKRKELVLEHGYDTKNAAHCIRLLRMCKEFLSSGALQVYRTTDAEELLNIKRGKQSLSWVKKEASMLLEECKIARDKSTLPDEPDRQGVEKMLVKILKDEFC
jgi:hypothetical protein